MLAGCFPQIKSVTKKSTLFFIFITRELSVNRNDLQVLNLAGLNRENSLLDPLAVPHLDN